MSSGWGMHMPHRLGKGSRRNFLQQLGALGISLAPAWSWSAFAAEDKPVSGSPAIGFPGPWQFLRPKPSIILVNDQQLEDLQDPDKQVDLSLSGTPNLTTLRRICQGAKDQGARTVILAFDEFWSQ